MRKKSSLKPALLFLLLILSLLSIPAAKSSAFKGSIMEGLTPFWSMLQPKNEPDVKSKDTAQKAEELKIEIRELRQEIKHLKAILKEEEIGKTKVYPVNNPRQKAAAARIIFRPPLFWSSFVLIDKGDAFNEAAGRAVISKGSPVISQGALVGVVDWVGKKMSRVRLITDEGLQPSVRIVRGEEKDSALDGLALRLILELESEAGEAARSLSQQLKSYLKRHKKSEETLFLAKGVLQGRSQPLWRSSSLELKGFGFNYDFSDEEGPARDLLTGKTDNPQEEAVPIIKAGDLLVTSGLDGIFPEGIPVAYVKQVDKLKEGDFYFSIRAIPYAPHINQLADVFVLPSLSLHEENIVQIR
ncbi:rod shape-determining protein MreC [Estrella lausannensis]|uniref:Cell shape-determining protein MreC n=1 Tax=Estrella lausannensis TaxID=483423 RepID=A0A0H5DPP9_9BACT|nr:rod shape-determining protein MreC [Estrella lausannensis]CRX37464.1 Putative rod shape-determining protein MreC [Estrella lausannensis]